RQLAAAATDNGGEVHVVLVNCRDEIRRERIVDESRVRMRKLTDPDSVERQRHENALFSVHPDWKEETLVIDTSDISADESASLIVQRFGLQI
ncbi:MAG: hypothetical protein ACJ73D_11930, partial [Pyrinomonadaceae bacterium]